MSVEQTDVVDIESIERETGNVILTISDHLDWSDSLAHQSILQKKLNTYLAFVESGEILEQYPKAKDRPVVLNVVFRCPSDESGQAFITRARALLESAGFPSATKCLQAAISTEPVQDAPEHWPVINAISSKCRSGGITLFARSSIRVRRAGIPVLEDKERQTP